MTKRQQTYQPGDTVYAAVGGRIAECGVIRRTRYTMWIDTIPLGRIGAACIDISGGSDHLRGLGPYSAIRVIERIDNEEQ